MQYVIFGVHINVDGLPQLYELDLMSSQVTAQFGQASQGSALTRQCPEVNWFMKYGDVASLVMIVLIYQSIFMANYLLILNSRQGTYHILFLKY